MAANQHPERREQRLQFGPGQRGRVPAVGGNDRQRQPRVGDHAAPEHQRVAARALAAAQRVGHAPDFAVGDHRDDERRTDLGDALPVRRRAVAVGLGARVHDEFVGAGGRDRLRAFERTRRVVDAEPHLGRDRHRSRHRAAHRGDDAVQVGRVAQQGRAAAVAVDDLRRAAEVQIDPGRAEAGGARRVLGQAHRVGAHQLQPHRHAGARAPAMQQLGHDAGEHALRQQRAGDADELGHAAIDAADAGEHVAQRVVEQPLHRGEQDGRQG